MLLIGKSARRTDADERMVVNRPSTVLDVRPSVLLIRGNEGSARGPPSRSRALPGLHRSTSATDGMLPSMGDYVAINKAMWDERAPAHAASADYGFDRFIGDPEYVSGVVRFDRPRLGELTGQHGVHLQCHIGTDTLTTPLTHSARRLCLTTGSALGQQHRTGRGARDRDRLQGRDSAGVQRALRWSHPLMPMTVHLLLYCIAHCVN